MIKLNKYLLAEGRSSKLSGPISSSLFLPLSPAFNVDFSWAKTQVISIAASLIGDRLVPALPFIHHANARMTNKSPLGPPQNKCDQEPADASDGRSNGDSGSRQLGCILHHQAFQRSPYSLGSLTSGIWFACVRRPFFSHIATSLGRWFVGSRYNI